MFRLFKAARGEISGRFKAYDRFGPKVPVWCITPRPLERCIHRFFDSSPVSPSGRYVALTRLPDESRPPFAGEPADVVVVDLATAEWSAVASTRGYDTQLGAQVQWGRNDRELYFNDMDVKRWRPFAVRMDPLAGTKVALEGSVYMVSPDGARLASPCLLRTALTQGGYGVVAPAAALPVNGPADDSDGLYITDAESGRCALLASFARICESVADLKSDVTGSAGALYGFHVKWNAQGTRLMFVVRLRRGEGQGHGEGPLTKNYVVTMNADGSDIRLALPAAIWARGGHHPNWCPDGEHIIQNLKLDGSRLQFVRYRYDGSGLGAVAPTIDGGGHPTLHPDGRHLLTDAYLGEKATFGDGTTPLRWIDIETGTETALVRIRTKPLDAGPMNVLRVDPHPAWDRPCRRVVFNACPDGRRRVFVADLSGLVAAEAGARPGAGAG